MTDVPSALFETIIREAADAIVSADAAGTIRFWNGGAERIFGYAAGEAIGRSLDLIIPGRLRGRHWEGFQSVIVGALPAYKRELQQRELEAAGAAGIDALVTVYHSDHRELCAHERDWPFQIVNILEIVGAGMGLHQADDYKRLKLMQDADAIVADCSDLIAKHKLNVEEARGVVAKAMLADQPLPLRGPTTRS